jgi:hypothetical protein
MKRLANPRREEFERQQELELERLLEDCEELPCQSFEPVSPYERYLFYISCQGKTLSPGSQQSKIETRLNNERLPTHRRTADLSSLVL